MGWLAFVFLIFLSSDLTERQQAWLGGRFFREPVFFLIAILQKPAGVSGHIESENKVSPVSLIENRFVKNFSFNAKLPAAESFAVDVKQIIHDASDASIVARPKRGPSCRYFVSNLGKVTVPVVRREFRRVVANHKMHLKIFRGTLASILDVNPEPLSRLFIKPGFISMDIRPALIFAGFTSNSGHTHGLPKSPNEQKNTQSRQACNPDRLFSCPDRRLSTSLLRGQIAPVRVLGTILLLVISFGSFFVGYWGLRKFFDEGSIIVLSVCALSPVSLYLCTGILAGVI